MERKEHITKKDREIDRRNIEGRESKAKATILLVHKDETGTGMYTLYYTVSGDLNHTRRKNYTNWEKAKQAARAMAKIWAKKYGHVRLLISSPKYQDGDSIVTYTKEGKEVTETDKHPRKEHITKKDREIDRRNLKHVDRKRKHIVRIRSAIYSRKEADAYAKKVLGAVRWTSTPLGEITYYNPNDGLVGVYTATQETRG